MNFWDVLNRVEPLRNELKSLELEAAENRTKAEQVLQVITELEHSIARYKEEYAMLISQAQAIKSDLSAVEAKVCFILICICMLLSFVKKFVHKSRYLPQEISRHFKKYLDVSRHVW